MPINKFACHSRLRSSSTMRALVAENKLDIDQIIYPMFIRHGLDDVRPIESMPGQYQWTLDKLAPEILQLNRLGINTIMLFGIPQQKDLLGADNTSSDGLMARAIKIVKNTCPQMLVVSDMCLCDYASHGHCFITNPDQSFNTMGTLAYLQAASVNHARAGADMIAPSGMVDGMVQAIRHALDESAYAHIPIMSYSVKYASAFYGPFRKAAESTPQFGDRKTYQMHTANAKEAIKEVYSDIDEGADIIMIKPALAYLDIIKEIADTTHVPIAAYQVSGEYSMLHAAANNGWLDLQQSALESLLSIKRAGANIILTYFAKDLAKWLNK